MLRSNKWIWRGLSIALLTKIQMHFMAGTGLILGKEKSGFKDQPEMNIIMQLGLMHFVFTHHDLAVCSGALLMF